MTIAPEHMTYKVVALARSDNTIGYQAYRAFRNGPYEALGMVRDTPEEAWNYAKNDASARQQMVELERRVDAFEVREVSGTQLLALAKEKKL